MTGRMDRRACRGRLSGATFNLERRPLATTSNTQRFKVEKCTLGGCSSRFLWPWVRRWMNHWSLWRTASAMPNLRSPSRRHQIFNQVVVGGRVWWTTLAAHIPLPSRPSALRWWTQSGRGIVSSADTIRDHTGRHARMLDICPCRRLPPYLTLTLAEPSSINQSIY